MNDPTTSAVAAGNVGLLHVPTLSEALVKRLRTLIFSGELRPGDRLVEERLARRFGVSRPPLREAMRVLAQRGIVTSLPRRGFVVTPMSATDIREIYELRFALERTAVELGVPIADSTRLRPIVDALDAMRGRSAQRDPDLMLEANSAFHSALVWLPGNSRLAGAYAAIRDQLEMCMAANLRFRQQFYNDPRDVVKRHEELLSLLQAGRVEPLLHSIANHGDRSFLDRLEELIGTVDQHD